eukprot:Gb_40939 [translate_table: standard]
MGNSQEARSVSYKAFPSLSLFVSQAFPSLSHAYSSPFPQLTSDIDFLSAFLDSLTHILDDLDHDKQLEAFGPSDRIDHGKSQTRNRLGCKRALVILDDVDHHKQLDALAPSDWFGEGSRIIVITRDQHVLNVGQADKDYEMEALEDESVAEDSQYLQRFIDRHNRIGYEMESAIKLWKASGRNANTAVKNLTLKSLVTVDKYDCFVMHDHLRDLGRRIVKEESVEELPRLFRVAENLHYIWMTSMHPTKESP